METILIIDDEESLCRTLEKVLGKEGYRVVWATMGSAGLELARKESPACVLLDLKLADTDGLTVLKGIRECNPHLPVIMLTAYETVKTAVQAMKQGAFHYMAKPFDNEELKVLIQKAIETRQMFLQIQDLKSRLGESEELEGSMGVSPKIQEAIKLVRSVAATDVNVLLLGESGSGKELVARAIHNLSRRKTSPFVPVDCAAIPETLMESELFGHEKGAFTGATSLQEGDFQAADGGTLFLDEVGNIPPSVQPKLLRFLEMHEFKRVGGRKPIRTSVRVIAATNADLARKSKERLLGESPFRLDLLYRLNEFPIQLPPLRERREDIPFLCQRFLAQFSTEVGKEILEFAPEALEKLRSYSYPGNVRELKNIVKRALVVARDRIELIDLPIEVRHPERSPSAPREVTFSIEEGLPLMEASRRVTIEIEKKLIRDVLSRTEGHHEKAARLLGISRRTLYNKMRELGIQKVVGG